MPLETRSPRVVVDEVRVRPTTEHRKAETITVEAHVSHSRSGKRELIPARRERLKAKTIKRKGYKYKRKELRYNGGFNALARQVSNEYYKKFRKEGMSPKEARKKADEWGRGTAANVYRHKEAESAEGRGL